MSVIAESVTELAESLRTPTQVQEPKMVALEGVSDKSVQELNNFLLDRAFSSDGHIVINRRGAMAVPAFSRSVTLLSGLMSQLISGRGLHVVDIQTDERITTPRARHMINLLMESPDNEIPSIQFIEDLSMDYLIDGNALVVPDMVNGRVISLTKGYPLESQRLASNISTLQVATDVGVAIRARRDLILSRWPLSFDNVRGDPKKDFAPSNIDILRTSLSLALSADQYVLEYFRSLAGKRAVNFAVLMKNFLQPTQLAEARALMSELIQEGGPYVLGESSIQNLNESAQDSNTKALREIQIRQISGHYGVPAVLVGEESTSWGTGIEELAKILVRFGLNVHISRFLDPFSLVMLPSGQKFAVDKSELTAASIESLTKLATVSLGDMQRPAFMTQSEVRKLFGHAPDPSLPSRPFVPPQAANPSPSIAINSDNTEQEQEE